MKFIYFLGHQFLKAFFVVITDQGSNMDVSIHLQLKLTTFYYSTSDHASENMQT